MFTARLIPRPFVIFLLASAMAARGGIAHCQELTQEQRHRFGVMNVFDPFASESNVTANVGERRILMRPGAFGLDYFPDEAIAVLSQRPFRTFVVAGRDTFLVSGQHSKSIQRADKVLSPGPRGSVDNGYAGIKGVFVEPGTRRLIAVYHAEDQENLPRVEVNNVAGAYWRACLAISRNGGRSFEKRGPIISSLIPKQTTASSRNPKLNPIQGAGEPAVCVDKTGQYLYCYYTEAGQQAERGFQICMARCPVSEADQPGAWKKFYRGTFSKPGLGGDDTPVVSAWPHGHAHTSHVTYSQALDQYIMVFGMATGPEMASLKLKKSGIYLTTSDDGIRWRKPIQLWKVLPLVWTGQEIATHAALIPAAGARTSKQLLGELLYGYSPNWGVPSEGRVGHHLAARSITLRLKTAASSTVESTSNRKPHAFEFDGKSHIICKLRRVVPVTLEAWVRPRFIDSDVFVIGSFSFEDHGIGLGINNGFLRAQCVKNDFGCGQVVPTDRWSHIAATFGPAETQIFFNGKPVGKGPGTKPGTDARFVIGQLGDQIDLTQYHGQIRAVRITSGIRFRSEFDPDKDFQKRTTAKGFKTMLAYDARQVKGSRVIDLSGNGNDGYIEGVRVVPVD